MWGEAISSKPTRSFHIFLGLLKFRGILGVKDSKIKTTMPSILVAFFCLFFPASVTGHMRQSWDPSVKRRISIQRFIKYCVARNRFPNAAFSSLVGTVHPNRLGLSVTTDQGD
jgi:hypothetical protein